MQLKDTLPERERTLDTTNNVARCLAIHIMLTFHKFASSFGLSFYKKKRQKQRYINFSANNFCHSSKWLQSLEIRKPFNHPSWLSLPHNLYPSWKKKKQKTKQQTNLPKFERPEGCGSFTSQIKNWQRCFNSCRWGIYVSYKSIHLWTHCQQLIEKSSWFVVLCIVELRDEKEWN